MRGALVALTYAFVGYYAPVSFVATDDSLQGRGGLYINYNRRVIDASGEARNADIAARLWESTCRVIALKPDFVAAGGAPLEPYVGTDIESGNGGVASGAGATAGAGAAL